MDGYRIHVECDEQSLRVRARNKAQTSLSSDPFTVEIHVVASW
jgi:hypothetical protein